MIALMVGAGFCAGLVDAIAGGGGLVTLPALLVAGLPPQVALATNKGQAVFGASISCATFWRRDGIDRSRAGISFAAAFGGSLAGAGALLVTRADSLRPLVIVLLVLASAVVLWPRKPTAPASALRHPRLALLAITLGLGAYDGFFGPGTGSLLIAAFVLCFADTPTRASGNAKVANLASNLAAALLFASRGTIVWWIALPMAAANMAGAALGARLAIAKGDRLVRAAVLAVVVAAIVRVTYDLSR
jgi:uncharacterized membrane protein YfcA